MIFDGFGVDFGTPETRKIAILLGTCRKSRKVAGSEIDSFFHRFWTPFWLHFPIILALLFNPFSASFFGCLFGRLFTIFGRKWSPKGSKTDEGFSPECPQNAPRSIPERLWVATSIFHRFGIDLGTNFGAFFVFSAPILAHFLLVRRFRCF